MSDKLLDKYLVRAELPPDVRLIQDDEDAFIIEWHDKLGRPVSMGINSSTYQFHRNKDL